MKKLNYLLVHLILNLNTNDIISIKSLSNEPASFESKDSKTSMLLHNFGFTKIVNEPGEKVLTFSSARFFGYAKE